MKYADAAVRADDAMVIYEWLGVPESIEYNIFCGLDIAGIDAFQERLKRPAELTYTVDPVKLIRPDHGIMGNVPFEAADMCHALRLRQSRFASGQALLGFALGRHVERYAQATGYSSVLVPEWFEEHCIPPIRKIVLKRLPLA